jgi:hypothetical protein
MEMEKTMSYDFQPVEAFNRELDRLISRGRIPADIKRDAVHDEMLSIAHTLATANLASLSKGRASLRQRLLAPGTFPTRRRIPGAVKLAATLSLLLMVAVLAFSISPPLRAWAQEVLARIGHLLITDAPTHAERVLPTIQTGLPDRPKGPLLESLSQEEANRRVGFTVLVPRDVPESAWEEGYRPAWGAPKEVTWDIFEMPHGVIVRCDCFRWHHVHILQYKLMNEQSLEFPVGDAEVVEVTVRDQAGYWIEEAPTGIVGGGGSTLHGMQDLVWGLAYDNILAWEEEGVVYVIMGDDELSLDDLLMVAEHLAP